MLFDERTMVLPVTVLRLKVFVHGIVQGVGFRPFVFNLARSLKLEGFVCNNGGIAEIEIEGTQSSIDFFLKELLQNPPPLAHIEKIETEACAVVSGKTGFQITESKNSWTGERYVPIDTATCKECLSELFSSSNRRYLYPFINCIDCGPRFTIIESLPYDRPQTTMNSFKMCACCEAEYNDLCNRRFHAQPNACNDCGPQLFLEKSGSPQLRDQPALTFAIELLQNNQMLAVKGLGGFHLIGNAQSPEIIETIRELKSRKHKPLAVMFCDVTFAREFCHMDESEQSLLESAQRPIVLLRRKKTGKLPEAIAPNLDEVGAMLPYTPLHHLLARACDFPLVATSANKQGMPILIDNEQAIDQYGKFAVLSHNREIYSGYDDSIMRAEGGRNITLRRARGLAPGQLSLPFEASRPALAVGSHLKNTFCLAKGFEARISQHLGDIETIERLNNFENTLLLYEHLFDIQPQLIAADHHPHYQTTLFAETLAQKRGLPLIRVQHHHAHAVSVMAENRIESALAVVFDGTGLGTDGNFWGGEFLHATYEQFERLAHLEYIPMPGGEAAIKEPWRMALGFTAKLDLLRADSCMSDFLGSLQVLYGAKKPAGVIEQIEKNLNTPQTSSCGRLFDAVSALIWPDCRPTYEGQAAMELEAFASSCSCSLTELAKLNVRYEIESTIVKTTALFKSIQEAILRGHSRECVVRAFHVSLSKSICGMLQILRVKTGNSRVCLAGGVFQNTLLTSMVEQRLLKENFQVFFPRQLPINDGGISYGQAVVALSKFES